MQKISKSTDILFIADTISKYREKKTILKMPIRYDTNTIPIISVSPILSTIPILLTHLYKVSPPGNPTIRQMAALTITLSTEP